MSHSGGYITLPLLCPSCAQSCNIREVLRQFLSLKYISPVVYFYRLSLDLIKGIRFRSLQCQLLVLPLYHSLTLRWPKGELTPPPSDHRLSVV